ncbi:MAG: glucose-6-phosphate dehydrogenase [Anaerolineae bacterium]|nr:glucose-6-phosphate dehydrogenase [Anaerolineae bacterium]
MVENPLRVGPGMERPPNPVTVVIFGATGDLTARKLVPALYSLVQEDQISPHFEIVGFARRDWADDFFREKMFEGVTRFSRFAEHAADSALWGQFSAHLHYVQGNFDQPERYRELDRTIAGLAQEQNRPDNRLYYLATPPSWYDVIIENIGKAGMVQGENGWRRIVIEKPFGVDLASARALNGTLHSVFDESQVYRIDHYLGKETVQNILVLRFANAIYEPIWNRRYVDHVQISVAESVGVGSRAGYYDQAGVVRDMFQNHILQLLTLVAMEPPVAFEADAIRDEKVKVLRAIRPQSVDEVAHHSVRAQYTDGAINGEPIPGYCELEGTAEGSQTPTYAALRWQIDNWRWQGVPIYMRSGKCMPTRVSEISIHFKQPPHLLFDAVDDESLRSNVLALRIQPDEGISLKFESKLPGQGVRRRPVTMDFRYGASFGLVEPPDAYERLLLDAMLGDAMLFTRGDEIEAAWQLIDPVIQGWEASGKPDLEIYEAGTWGPPGADHLLQSDGRRWRRL